MMLKISFRNLAYHPSLRARNEPVFGKLSHSGKKVLATQISENYFPEDPDGYDKEEYDLGPKKNQYYYKEQLLLHARKGPAGLKKALELFEDLKSKDKLEPHFRHFSLLINSCAKVGFTQRAFDLYREFLRYNKKPSLSIVNSLINACAECPFRDYGLSKLKWFRDHLKVDQNIELNIIHYNTLIKAYGRLNEPAEIETVMEEMFQNQILPDRDTYNMLLIACASNKESGSILALRVFKQMKLYDFKPNSATYRLFLRSVRDCGMGSRELIKKTFAELPAMTTINQRIKLNTKSVKRNNKSDESGFVWVPPVNEIKKSIISGIVHELSGKANGTGNNDKRNQHKSQQDSFERSGENPLENHNQLTLSMQQSTDTNMVPVPRLSSELYDLDDRSLNEASSTLPNLLSDDHLDLFTRIDSIQIDQIKSPPRRLMLFGGVHGFLQKMVDDSIRPCNKIFGLLLGCSFSRRTDIIEFYRLALDFKIKKDVAFYDMLIRHAAWNILTRDRLNLATYFLERMQKDTDLSPNITTYESLAYACDKIEQANKLITDLESCGFTISSRLIRQFFDPPMYRKDFKYLNELVLLCTKRKYKPPKELIDKLEGVKIDAHDVILRYEKDILKDSQKPKWFDESQIPHYDNFTQNLDKWLKMVSLVEEDHPWEQFYVERKSKRQGFVEFVEKFKAIEQAKQKALESGQEMNNLMEEAEKILSAKKEAKKIIVPSEDRILNEANERV